jgi:hypothetical protein
MQVLTAGRRLIGETLECDSCGREVNTYMSRHKAGGACGGLLNQYSSDDPGSEKPVELCKGRFENVNA